MSKQKALNGGKKVGLKEGSDGGRALTRTLPCSRRSSNVSTMKHVAVFHVDRILVMVCHICAVLLLKNEVGVSGGAKMTRLSLPVTQNADSTVAIDSVYPWMIKEGLPSLQRKFYNCLN